MEDYIIILKLLIAVAVFLVMKIIGEKYISALPKNVLKNPKNALTRNILWASLPIGICFMVLFNLITNINENLLRKIIVFIVFSIVSFVPIIRYFLWKIEVKDDGIIFRNYLGVKKSCEFHQMKIEKKNLFIIYKNNEHFIIVHPETINVEFLVEKYKEYKKKHKTK